MSEYYTIRKIALYLGISISQVKRRAGMLFLKPFVDENDKRETQYYTFEQFILIKNFKLRNEDVCPEIIYVTRTTEIYQSKLNFLELHQL